MKPFTDKQRGLLSAPFKTSFGMVNNLLKLGIDVFTQKLIYLFRYEWLPLIVGANFFLPEDTAYLEGKLKCYPGLFARKLNAASGL